MIKKLESIISKIKNKLIKNNYLCNIDETKILIHIL